MTTPPPAADWYPDPSGKPGLMYWDGQRWHTDIPDAPPRADDELPPQSTSTTPQPRRHRALIAVLVMTVVVLAAGMGIAGYLLLQHSHASQTPTAQPAPSGQIAQPAYGSSSHAAVHRPRRPRRRGGGQRRRPLRHRRGPRPSGETGGVQRLGHSTPAAAMRYQHAAQGRDREIAALLSKLANNKAL
jgi:hypothetical protein